MSEFGIEDEWYIVRGRLRLGSTPRGFGGGVFDTLEAARTEAARIRTLSTENRAKRWPFADRVRISRTVGLRPEPPLPQGELVEEWRYGEPGWDVEG